MFEDLSLTALHQRRSAKWTVFPPDVLPAWVAEMDYPLAPALKAALHEAIERDDCGYPREGELPQAFAAFAQRAFGWTVDPNRTFMIPDVMVGVGETLRLLTPRDAPVAINSPIYPPFFGVPKEVERRALDVPLLETGSGWVLDLDGLERAFAGGVKTYLLCNPHNPVGRAFTRTELEAIADLAQRYGVLVLSDEIHAPLMMPGVRHTPFTEVAEPRGVECVVLSSASKAWNVPGLKCAVLVSGTPRLTTVPTEVRYRAGILGVVAAIAAYRKGEEWRQDAIAKLDRNRRLLGEMLQAYLPDVRYRAPEASYLAWLDCGGLGLDEDPAGLFLRKGRVALSRGRDFGGAPYARFVRLNFATSEGILEQVVTRMRAAL